MTKELPRFTNEEMKELNSIFALKNQKIQRANEEQFLANLVLDRYNVRMKELLKEKGLDPEKKYNVGEDNVLTEIKEEKKAEPKESPKEEVKEETKKK